MNIPKLKKIKSEKKYHEIILKDDYSWVDQPDILEVLKNPYLEQKNIINYQIPLSSNEKYQTFCGT